MEVLAGAEKIIDQQRPAVFGEFSRVWFERRRIMPTEPIDWAHRHGYRGYEVRPERLNTPSARNRPHLVELSIGSARQVDSVLLVPGELVENDGLASLPLALQP